MLTRDASCDGGSTKKWCGSRDHRKPVRLIDSGAVLIAFRVGRTQVDQCIIRRVAAILLEASEQRVADSDGPLFIVLRFEAELCFEANRNRLVFPIDVHPLGDRSLSNAEPVPTRKRVRASFIEFAT